MKIKGISQKLGVVKNDLTELLYGLQNGEQYSFTQRYLDKSIRSLEKLQTDLRPLISTHELKFVEVKK